MASRSDTGDRRRESLITAAETLFAARGYDSTSISDIVREVGASQGTFYYHFESKDDIIGAILDRYVDQVCERLEETRLKKDLPFVEMLNEATTATASVHSAFLHRLHSMRKTDVHVRLVSKIVSRVPPIYAQVLKDHEFDLGTDQPTRLATIELVVTAAQTLLDSDVFRWTLAEYATHTRALRMLIEKVLDLAAGTLEPFERQLNALRAEAQQVLLDSLDAV